MHASSSSVNAWSWTSHLSGSTAIYVLPPTSEHLKCPFITVEVSEVVGVVVWLEVTDEVIVVVTDDVAEEVNVVDADVVAEVVIVVVGDNVPVLVCDDVAVVDVVCDDVGLVV